MLRDPLPSLILIMISLTIFSPNMVMGDRLIFSYTFVHAGCEAAWGITIGPFRTHKKILGERDSASANPCKFATSLSSHWQLIIPPELQSPPRHPCPGQAGE